jgi:uncharacterized repeat protein (TIGR03803 family)
MPNRGRAVRFLVAVATASVAAAASADAGYGIHSMQAATTGAVPAGRLVLAPDGSLVGTAENGGPGGHGTVYRIDTQGGMSTVHAFDGSDGESVVAGLAPGAGGWYYGASAWGAANGLGGLFRVALDGRFEMLHSFDDRADHGAVYPYSALTPGPDGSFYGTTVYSAGYPAHNGTLFKLTPDGQVHMLYVFGRNARNPYGGVTFGRDGLLYGTTSSDARYTCGVLYSIATDGSGFRIVHHFDDRVDGCQPRSTMVADADGTLVGTTQYGGTLGGVGAIYRFDPATRAVTVLHVFHDDDPLGTVPVAGLSRDAGGSFHGATTYGSSFGQGAVFTLAANGTMSLQHAFAADGSEGSGAATAPTPMPGGGVAGTTLGGGATGAGAVYRVTP